MMVPTLQRGNRAVDAPASGLAACWAVGRDAEHPGRRYHQSSLMAPTLCVGAVLWTLLRPGWQLAGRRDGTRSIPAGIPTLERGNDRL